MAHKQAAALTFERKDEDYPVVYTETKCGRIRLAFTSGAHVYTENYPHAVNVEGHGPLMVNGVAYSWSCHFEPAESNAEGWVPQRERYSHGGYGSEYVYMTRVGSFRHDSWTWPARKKAVAVVAEAIKQAVESDPSILPDAARYDANKKRAQAIEVLKEKRAALREAEAEVQKAAKAANALQAKP